MTEPLKCNKKRIENCKAQGMVCNNESGKCVTIQTAENNVKKDPSLQLDKELGAVGKASALKLIRKYLASGEEIPLTKTTKEAKPSKPKSKNVDDTGYESPDDFGEGPTHWKPKPVEDKSKLKTEKMLAKAKNNVPTRDELRKLTAMQLRERLDNLGVKYLVRTKKDDLVNLLHKSLTEKPTITVSKARVISEETAQQSEEKMEKPVKVIKATGKKEIIGAAKYKGTTNPQLWGILLNKYGVRMPVKSKRAELIAQMIKEESNREKILEGCDKCDEDESCNVSTGECEDTTASINLYVLSHNGHNYHGKREALQALAKDLGFTGYTIEAAAIEKVSEKPKPKIIVPRLPLENIETRVSPPFVPPSLPPSPPPSPDISEEESEEEEEEENIYVPLSESVRSLQVPKAPAGSLEIPVEKALTPRFSLRELPEEESEEDESIRGNEPFIPYHERDYNKFLLRKKMIPDLRKIYDEEYLESLPTDELTKIYKKSTSRPISQYKQLEKRTTRELEQIATSMGIDTTDMNRNQLISSISQEKVEGIERTALKTVEEIAQEREEAREALKTAAEKMLKVKESEEELAEELISAKPKAVAMKEKPTIPELMKLADIVSGKKPLSREETKLVQKITECVGF